MNIQNFFTNLFACPIKIDWSAINQPFELLDTVDFFKDFNFKIEINLKKTVIAGERVSIGAETKIDDFVVIENNVIIGKNCVIRSGALIRSGSIIGDNCVIGHSSEVKNSVVFNGAKIASLAFVGDSVLGEGARIGSGTILGNRRFDQKDVVINFNEEKIETGRDKLGAIVGDFSRLGSNVSTAPGTMIGRMTWVASLISLSGVIPANKFIKLKQEQVVAENLRGKDLSHYDQAGRV